MLWVGWGWWGWGWWGWGGWVGGGVGGGEGGAAKMPESVMDLPRKLVRGSQCGRGGHFQQGICLTEWPNKRPEGVLALPGK